MNKLKTIHFKSLYSPINSVIFLGEVVKAAHSLWIVLLAPVSPFILIPLYLILQTISAPLQGGKSDTISRKSALLTTIVATGISQIFFFFSLMLMDGNFLRSFLLLIGLFIQGRWANISAVSRAALSDIGNHSHLIFTIPLSFCILSFPWLVLIEIFPGNEGSLHSFLINPQFKLYSKIVTTIIVSYSVIAFFFVKRSFSDLKDKELDNLTIEPKILDIIHAKGIRRIWLHVVYEPFFLRFVSKGILEILRSNILGWLGCIFYEFGFHSIFYYLDESGNFIKNGLTNQSSLFIYFIAGTLFRPICLSSNKFGILISILISILGVFFQNHSLPPALWQGCIGFGSGLFLSCFYLNYLTNQKIHSRGKIVGVADSMQTLGETLGTITYALLSMGLTKYLSSFIATDIKFLSLFLFMLALILFLISFLRKSGNQA